jgi:hypothetical protein
MRAQDMISRLDRLTALDLSWTTLSSDFLEFIAMTCPKLESLTVCGVKSATGIAVQQLLDHKVSFVLLLCLKIM